MWRERSTASALPLSTGPTVSPVSMLTIAAYSSPRRRVRRRISVLSVHRLAMAAPVRPCMRKTATTADLPGLKSWLADTEVLPHEVRCHASQLAAVDDPAASDGQVDRQLGELAR